jgi:hypothetical protein
LVNFEPNATLLMLGATSFYAAYRVFHIAEAGGCHPAAG